ncbi:MAG: hypothetical protein WAW36_01600 [Methylovulum miyakonense]|uniref:hypothetical protein n=1 Tax=Methylovulum miyakonense TaxID=645578 RepID=UPI003BB57C5B
MTELENLKFQVIAAMAKHSWYMYLGKPIPNQPLLISYSFLPSELHPGYYETPETIRALGEHGIDVNSLQAW